MRKLFTTLLATSALVLAAACGGGQESSASDDPAEPTKIKVGSTGLTVHAPLYIAKAKGWFAEENLDVTLEVLSGGAAIIPALVNGELQFGDSNIPSALLAISNGIDLRAVATNNVAADSLDDTGSLTSAVVAAKDGPISDPADLVGKTVAVNSLNNLGDLTTRVALRERGIDADQIKFVELPLPDMVGALQAKRVDAAWVVEPFLSAAKAGGMAPVLYNWEETAPGLPIGAYFTSESYLKKNPKVAEAFTRVVEKATTYAAENPEEVRKIILEYTKVPPPVAQSMALPVLTTSIERDGLQILMDEMVKTGALKKSFELDPIFSNVIK